MDKTVPAGAALLLDFIRETEVGDAGRAGYDAIYGHNQDKLAKPLTSMTIDDVIKAQPSWTKRFGSSAAGGPQFMRNTLLGLKKELGLTGAELLDPDMQDRLSFHLLKGRGYDRFMAGKLSRTAFGKALAQEWASFPVLAATQGSEHKVTRGQSYYAGDGLNKSLVAPAKVEAVLDQVRARGRGRPTSPRPAPAPRPPAVRAIDDPATVSLVQGWLRNLGYTEVGPADGKIGPFTRTAIRAFRAENGLPEGEEIDQALIVALATAKPRQIAPERKEATPAEVREKVPEAKATWQGKVAGWWTAVISGVGAAISGAMDYLGDAKGYLDPVKEFAGDVPGWVWFAAVAIGAFVLSRTLQKGEAASVQAFQEGARR
jgi:hypothetical protein